MIFSHKSNSRITIILTESIKIHLKINNSAFPTPPQQQLPPPKPSPSQQPSPPSSPSHTFRPQPQPPSLHSPTLPASHPQTLTSSLFLNFLTFGLITLWYLFYTMLMFHSQNIMEKVHTINFIQENKYWRTFLGFSLNDFSSLFLTFYILPCPLKIAVNQV